MKFISTNLNATAAPSMQVQYTTVSKLEADSLNYQLAFFTPGIFPSKALSRNGYYELLALHLLSSVFCIHPYPSHAKIAQHPSRLSTFYTSIVDLRESGICMHLRQLKLGLCSNALGKSGVANHVSKSLSIMCVDGKLPLALW